MCADTYTQILPLFHFTHHGLSLSPGFSALPIPRSPSRLFSLLHFPSHRGSGGPPPQSIMVKSQSTAAHSGHCADKLVREERRREKKRGEEKRRRGGETGGCTWREAWREGEGALGSLHSQRVGTLSARAGREWMGEPIPLVKPP